MIVRDIANQHGLGVTTGDDFFREHRIISGAISLSFQSGIQLYAPGLRCGRDRRENPLKPRPGHRFEKTPDQVRLAFFQRAGDLLTPAGIETTAGVGGTYELVCRFPHRP